MQEFRIQEVVRQRVIRTEEVNLQHGLSIGLPCIITVRVAVELLLQVMS